MLEEPVVFWRYIQPSKNHQGTSTAFRSDVEVRATVVAFTIVDSKTSHKRSIFSTRFGIDRLFFIIPVVVPKTSLQRSNSLSQFW
jgi:hypothetical protein